MKEQWVDWFAKNSGQNPTKAIIYSWFRKAFGSITAVNIIKAFLTSGISNDADGSEDILSANLLLLKTKQVEVTQVKEQSDEKAFYEDAYGSPEHQNCEIIQRDHGEYVFEITTQK